MPRPSLAGPRTVAQNTAGRGHPRHRLLPVRESLSATPMQKWNAGCLLCLPGSQVGVYPIPDEGFIVMQTARTPRIAIVVPCYNEGRRLPVACFQRFLSESCVELIFVDDGSRDNTRDVLEKIRAGREDRVMVLKCQTN